MSKIVYIGDTHGRREWKSIIEKEKPNFVRFLGDYFDSFNVGWADQMNNFRDIIEFKKSSGIDTKLIIGNHDYHYYPGIYETYSGYQGTYAHLIRNEIQANKEHLQIAFEENGFLITHAGVTKTFLKNKGYKEGSIADFLNDLFNYKPQQLGFQNGFNFYGDEIHQSCIWVRPNSLIQDAVEGYNQIVGHTRQPRVLNIEDRFYFIDCLEDGGNQYLVSDGEGKPKIGQL